MYLTIPIAITLVQTRIFHLDHCHDLPALLASFAPKNISCRVSFSDQVSPLLSDPSHDFMSKVWPPPPSHLLPLNLISNYSLPHLLYLSRDTDLALPQVPLGSFVLQGLCACIGLCA